MSDHLKFKCNYVYKELASSFNTADLNAKCCKNNLS